MKYLVIVAKRMKVAGMAFYPFILINDERLRNDEVLLRHEQIHLKQQAELLVLPFYLLYLFNYLLNSVKYSSHNKAYQNIIFEREAYRHEAEPAYLQQRKLWAWWQER